MTPIERIEARVVELDQKVNKLIAQDNGSILDIVHQCIQHDINTYNGEIRGLIWALTVLKETA